MTNDKFQISNDQFLLRDLCVSVVILKRGETQASVRHASCQGSWAQAQASSELSAESDVAARMVEAKTLRAMGRISAIFRGTVTMARAPASRRISRAKFSRLARSS